MRKILLATALVAMSVTMSAAKKTVIDRIEPTDWYVGMKNPQVQLMVYGKGIKQNIDLGIRTTLSDVAQTIADIFELSPMKHGTSFKKEIF